MCIRDSIVTDIDQFTDGLLLGFTQLFTGVITIIGTICFMLGINPWITLVVVILSPFSFFIASFISKRSFNMFRKQSQTRGNMTGFVNEMLGNIKVVKVFDHGEKAQEEFDQINDCLLYTSWKVNSPYGDIDITINLSKPEKDPKALSLIHI